MISLLLIAGCSAAAYDNRHEERVLDSLNDQAFQGNPELILSKCFELSDIGRAQCYSIYVQAKEFKGEPLPSDVCDKIGQDVCSGAVWG